MDYISFFKPEIGDDEINEVNDCLRSGWLTTGARCKRFEEDFAKYIGRPEAVALNSCTAALHLALEAVGLKERDVVLVPTMTFAATAEVVRYFNAIPVLVDCHADDFCMDMAHAERLLDDLAAGREVPGLPADHGPVKGIIPVHYAGQAADVLRCRALADKHHLFLVEDCAHCCPAYYQDAAGAWKMVGSSADIACYSFYANKTITTGEGGMALTDNKQWADRMRVMSLHGISKDAWKRFSKAGSWYYEIAAPGFKYNMTDVAAAIGIHQLRKSDRFWERRRALAAVYAERLSGLKGVTLPVEKPNRKHSWHLYVIRIDKAAAGIGRDAFIEAMKAAEIGVGVHYMPLHLHPYYRDTYHLQPSDLPVASALFERIVTLPLYPVMTDAEQERVCETVRRIVQGA